METIEIERKYLVDVEKFKAYIRRNGYARCKNISQCYINSDNDHEIRVRFTSIPNDPHIVGEMFVKYNNPNNLLCRREFAALMEHKMNPSASEEYYKFLLDRDTKFIHKTRYEIYHHARLIEIDLFKGDSVGLVLAEIELDAPQDLIELPDFITTEVTGDERYYNRYIYDHPYNTQNN